jgi:hypothetical protein
MQNRFVSILIIILLLWAISTSVISAYLYDQNLELQNRLNVLNRKIEDIETSYTVYLIINYTNGTVEEYKLYVKDGINNTVFDVLTSVAKVNYTYYESFGDVLINAINDVWNDPGKGYYWIFYVNNEFSTTGAMNTKLYDGDKILWLYGEVGF